MRETAEQKLERLTQIERSLWAQGRAVAGMDEVGRGPLAGPVVTACVSIPMEKIIPGVDDSKKLSEKRRESLYDLLIAAAEYCEITFIPRETIDEINILNATRRAMEKSASGFRRANGVILIDAVEGLSLPCAGRAIVHGDAESYMIAAASVVAKVARDRHMIKLDETYPQYGFARNKGYGTAEHIAALKKYGPCPEHRRTFIGHFV
jgi:ribonuclease HII